MFKVNEGWIDRFVRLSFAALLLLTGLFLLGGWRGNAAGLVVIAISLFPFLTGITGFCPFYVPFKFSTVGMERRWMRKCTSMMSRRQPRACMEGAGMCVPGTHSGEHVA